jgi:subtilisin family serine protease
VRPLAAALALAAVAIAVRAGDDGTPAPPTWAQPHNAVGIADAAAPARYIVRFKEAALASYNETIAADPARQVAGIAAIPMRSSSSGRAHLDTKSAPARSYAAWLADRQNDHLVEMATVTGATVVPARRFVHALNAVVVDLDEVQAAKVAQLDGIAAVSRERHASPATDIGPGFIGAPNLWWGTPASQDTVFASGFEAAAGTFGDGIVIGVIDSGYNSSSPSFQAADVNGRAILNPLGAGHYLGQCALPGISDAGCNDKVIGVYDEVDDGSATAPYSVEDLQAHGSHTASTVLGDARLSPWGGVRLSGVAPRANLVAYYACAPAPVFCPESATVGSVDSAVADGVVDVLNYSLTGGTSPWSDATSQAFLGATEAGIFVATAAGNTGAGVLQRPGLANHLEPWTTTVAAGTHTGTGTFAAVLNMSGPGTPPASTQGIVLAEATPGTDTAPTGAIASTTRIVLSPQFDNTDTSGTDGCTDYPAATFDQAIAFVSRGTCQFYQKVDAAVAAGALAVVISDNRPETAAFWPDLSAGHGPVPVYLVSQTDGSALAAFLGAQPGAAGTAGIPYPYKRLAQTPDVLGTFSLLGPAPGIAMIKPDLQAPGVRILASVNNRNLPDGDGNPVAPNGADAVGMLDGTSMATPHVAGAAALLMALHPEWTPPEVKSALMLTALENGLTKSDGATPSDPFDRGAGRIRVDVAAAAGLVLDETGAHFSAADPAQNGDPATLNLASVQDLACGDARHLSREFTSTLERAMHWSVQVQGDPVLSAHLTLGASAFDVAARQRHALDIVIDCAALPADGATRFADIVLSASDASLPPLHLPVAVGVPLPSIAAAPSPLAIALGGAASAPAALTVSNLGGATLHVDADSSSSATYVWLDQAVENDGTLYGYGNTFFTDRPDAASNQYSAEDFTISGYVPVDLAHIEATGHSFQATLGSVGPTLPLHWRIYADAGGAPAGNPDDASVTPAWSFDATAGDAGISIVEQPNLSGLTTDVVSLDLAAAGQHTALAPGHYWLLVYPSLPCVPLSPTACDGWYMDNSLDGAGAAPVQIAPEGSATWISIAAVPGFAMHVDSAASCVTPPWLDLSSLPLDVGPFGSDDVLLIANASGFGGANAVTGYLCLGSNDAVTPLLPVQVNASR